MSLKLERDLSATTRSNVTRAKAAAQTKNYDYAIGLMLTALQDEPLFFEGRRFLRAVEIQRYKGLSGFNRQMLTVKVTSMAMKLSSAGKKTPEEQLVLAEEVLAQDPYNLKANAMIADAGKALGFPEFKAFAYETLAEGKPTDKAILNTLADTYMELKDPVKAEKTYARILEIDPRDGDAQSGLKNASAAHASKSGGWETASDYRGALKSQAESEKLESDAKVVKSTEAIDKQIALFFEKHQADPANPAHSKAIAELFLQKDDYGSAIPFYQHAFESGGKVDASLEKIIDDLRLKKADQELTALKEAQEQITDADQQTQSQAAIEQKIQEINEVRLSQAEARVRNYPNEGQYHYELGEALYKVNQFKRALSELQLGLKQPNVRYQALNLMGLCFMAQKMFDLAIRRFSDAESEMLGMDEMKKEIVYNLGLAYEATKQAAKGLDQWKKIYEVDMGYRDVAKRVEESYGASEDAA